MNSFGLKDKFKSRSKKANIKKQTNTQKIMYLGKHNRFSAINHLALKLNWGGKTKALQHSSLSGNRCRI